MPIFKADGRLIYYAHVPKCGGSAVNWYLRERFGPLAFHDDGHTGQPERSRWSRSSPQHIDRASLARLFPPGFFDAVFTIVRHPVSRLTSAYHFQADVEGTIPAGTGFSDWLADLEDRAAEDPFVFDNHVRPMAEIVPEGAQVFHMEHGLDGLVAWFDALTGTASGPRAVPRLNAKGRHTGDTSKAAPSAGDIARIAALHAVDFDRFGYAPDRPDPAAAAPDLSPGQIRDRDRFLQAFNSPMGRMRRKIGRALGR